MLSLGCCGNVLKQVIDSSNIILDISNNIKIFERDVESVIKPFLDISNEQFHVLDAMRLFLNGNNILESDKELFQKTIQEKVQKVIQETIQEFTKKVSETIQQQTEVVKDVVQQVSDTIAEQKEVVQQVSDTIQQQTELVKDVVQQVSDTIAEQKDVVQEPITESK